MAGDLSNARSLRSAFGSANIIFAVTDFWTNFKAENKSQLRPGQTLNELACEMEVRQGKCIASAVPDSIELFILSTLSNSKKWSRGKYTKNHLFDGKAAIKEHIESSCPKLARKMSCIQVGSYLDDWKRFWSFAIQPVCLPYLI